MFGQATGAILGRLRALRRHQEGQAGLPAGVYYLHGSNEWVYVPPRAELVCGPEGSLVDPQWRVRTVVVSPEVAHDAKAPVRRALHSPAQLHPAADLGVSPALVDRIVKRARRAL